MLNSLHERVRMENENLNTNIEETKNEELTLPQTQEELLALIEKREQSAADRARTEAWKKARKQQDEAVKEAERLAKLSEEDRAKADLEKREKIIAEKEKMLQMMENKAEASKALASRGLSIELVDLVVAESAEDTLSNIKILEKCFRESVNAEVTKTLAGDAPKRNLGNTNGEMTREEFMKLPTVKQQEIFENNPTLYNKMVG